MTPYSKYSKDIISEEEFNQQIAAKKSTALPENDSPGDSEFDAGEEFDLGLEFTPEAALADEDLLDEEEMESLELQTPPRLSQPPRKTEEDLPASARGISSELPSPWMDNEKPTNTH